MTTLKLVIIEDEPLAAEKLQNFVRRYDATAQILAVLPSVAAVLDFFDSPQSAEVQLVLSDVALQDGAVFQALTQLELHCPLIFTTAYPDFGVQAFAHQAVGYLLKPFSYKSFAECLDRLPLLLDKLRQLSGTSQPNPPARPGVVSAAVAYRQRFIIRHANGQHQTQLQLLPVSQISCIQAVRGVLVATTPDGQQLLAETQLGSVEAELDPDEFFRLNRSELIRLGAVTALENHGKDHLAVYLTGAADPLISSKNRTADLRAWLNR